MPPTTPSSDAAAPTPDPPAWWWIALQLVGFAFYIPLSVLSGPQRGVVNPVSAMVVAVAVAVAGLVAYALLRRRAPSQWVALTWVSVALFFFWQWGAWRFDPSWIGWFLSAAIATLVAVALGRVGERWFVRTALFTVGTTLLVTLTGLIVIDVVNAPEPTLLLPDTPSLGEPVAKPDILYIVFDAYARDDVLAEEYDFDNAPFLDDLREAGFTVASSSNANYTMTHGSISSTLSLDYLESTQDYVNNSDLPLFKAMVSGDNAVVDLLRKAGYTYVHASADNWVNFCSGIEDVCLPGPRIDQTAFNLLIKTPVGPLLFPVSGDPTTALSRRRIEELTHWATFSSTLGAQPRFVYMHLGVPHAPTFLDADCQPRVEPKLAGQRLNDLAMSPELVSIRKAAYIDQVRCVNQTILEFMGQLTGDEVVIVTSDHGPDSHGLLIGDEANWTQDQVEERMRTMTAVRFPGSCPPTEDPDLQLVNLFRAVLTCIYETDALPPLDNRYYGVGFGGPIVPLPDPDAG